MMLVTGDPLRRWCAAACSHPRAGCSPAAPSMGRKAESLKTRKRRKRRAEKVCVRLSVRLRV